MRTNDNIINTRSKTTETPIFLPVQHAGQPGILTRG